MTARGDGKQHAAHNSRATALRPEAVYERPIRRILVLHRGVSPTTDIYLRPRLRSAAYPVSYHDILQPLPANQLDDGTFVVVVRYLNAASARALWAARSALSGVAYLMDDDIPQARRDASLPRDYRWTVAAFWMVFRPVLARIASEIWVTSPGLENAYAGRHVHRMDPLYVGPDRTRTAAADPDAPVRLFYHGGRTHAADQRWLRDVIERVQDARQSSVFEIFGDAEVAHLFASIPRCRVLQRLRWPDYLSYTAGERLDIGLAPAVSGPYNAARSFNKAYDITRTGAAGVYADIPSFRKFVNSGREGILAPVDSKDAWVEAILALIDDPARRRRIHAAALRRAHQIADRELHAPLITRFRAPPGKVQE